MAMILRVTLPSWAIPKLEAVAHEQGDKDLETAASQQLGTALSTLPATGRFAVVNQQELQTLEDILGGGSVLNGADLLKKVERLAGISFGHVRLAFTPGQLEDLKRKADRQGKTVEQLVDQMAPRIHEQFFGLIDNR